MLNPEDTDSERCVCPANKASVIQNKPGGNQAIVVQDRWDGDGASPPVSLAANLALTPLASIPFVLCQSWRSSCAAVVFHALTAAASRPGLVAPPLCVGMA